MDNLSRRKAISSFTLAFVIFMLILIVFERKLILVSQAQQPGKATPSPALETRPATKTPSPPLPSNQPVQGLIYDGLEAADEGPCKGFYRTQNTGICTHGPDPAPPGLDIKKGVAPVKLPDQPGAAALVNCDGDGVSGPRTQVIYARASNVPDRFQTYLTSFQQWAAEINTIYQASAAETGGSRLVRYVHDANCKPIIFNVVLSPAGDDDFGRMVDELQAQGYNREDRKYIVFVDAHVYCGLGGIWGNDQSDFANPNNFGPSYARVDAGCWGGEVAAHEHMHTLGGVQLSAPHSSGGFHCIDEYDMMCYSDYPNHPQMQYPCLEPGHETLFDCNHNDYFSTNPPAKSYLATYWNAANSQYLVGGFPPLPAQPDLRAYALPGHSYPVVPSFIRGTQAVTALYAGWTTYFDGHFINSSNKTFSNNFDVELWIDGTRRIHYSYSGLRAGESAGFNDWAINITAPGWHTVRLVTDPDNTVIEFDETNNTWEKKFYWSPLTPNHLYLPLIRR